MKQELNILEKLMRSSGPAGQEAEVQQDLRDLIEPMAHHVSQDPIGNTYFHLDGKSPKMLGPSIMFTAHCDTIGFMVKYIDEAGFVFTQDIGGDGLADAKMLPGMKVNILSRHNNEIIPGQFIPTIPFHLVEDENDDELTQVRHEMAIDIGASNEEEAQRLVDIGDYVLFRPQYERLGAKITGTFLDNRVGLYLLYMIAKMHQGMKNKPPLILASTVGEEPGSGNAGHAGTLIKPGSSITLDCCPATDAVVHDSEDEIFKKYGKFCLDSGPILTRGPGVCDEVFRDLEKICMKKKLDYQIELSKMDTDNQFIHNAGVKTGVVMVPIRNAHTCVEAVSEKDLDKTLKLCQAYIKTRR